MAEARDPVARPPAGRPVDVTQTSDDPQAIAADIRETRAEMDETIDALGAKLDPSHLVEEAKGALTSKAHDLVDRASDAISGSGSMSDSLSSSRLVETVKHNPLPAAAVGLSVAWFLSKLGESETNRYRRERYAATGDASYAPRRDPYGSSSDRHVRSLSDGSDNESLTDKASDAASTAKDKAAGLADRLGDAASDAGDRVSETASHLTREAKDKAHGAVDSLQHAEQRAESWLDHQMRSNPLSVGAVALAAGALVGLSIPESDAEDRLMGERAGRLKEQAAQVAREKADDLSTPWRR